MVGNTMQWLFLNKELLLLRLRKASVISSGIKQGTKLLTKILFSELNNQIWPFNVKSGEKNRLKAIFRFFGKRTKLQWLKQLLC